MDYTIVRVKQENLSLYAELLSKVFTETKKYTNEFLDWQYFKNPAGICVGFDAFYGNELAAHYITIPVIYTFQGKNINGLLSLNTVTHPKHQGKGLFLKLANATYALAQQLDYKFIIGVANQNSTHGFVKKLGFDLISKLDVKVYSGSVKPKLQYNNYFKSYWNEELLTWRLNCPDATYYNSKRSIFSKTHIPFFKSLITVEAPFYVPLRKIAFNPLKISIGLNLNAPSLAINLPDKLKPSPLNLIFRSLGNEKIEVRKSTIFFELIDFDAY